MPSVIYRLGGMRYISIPTAIFSLLRNRKRSLPVFIYSLGRNSTGIIIPTIIFGLGWDRNRQGGGFAGPNVLVSIHICFPADCTWNDLVAF